MWLYPLTWLVFGLVWEGGGPTIHRLWLAGWGARCGTIVIIVHGCEGTRSLPCAGLLGGRTRAILLALDDPFLPVNLGPGDCMPLSLCVCRRRRRHRRYLPVTTNSLRAVVLLGAWPAVLVEEVW